MMFVFWTNFRLAIYWKIVNGILSELSPSNVIRRKSCFLVSPRHGGLWPKVRTHLLFEVISFFGGDSILKKERHISMYIMHASPFYSKVSLFHSKQVLFFSLVGEWLLKERKSTWQINWCPKLPFTNRREGFT